MFEPDYLLFDEACQSTEPEALMALQSDPKFTIMMGDHKQLPPTVMMDKEIADKTMYSRSLF